MVVAEGHMRLHSCYLGLQSSLGLKDLLPWLIDMALDRGP